MTAPAQPNTTEAESAPSALFSFFGADSEGEGPNPLGGVLLVGGILLAIFLLVRLSRKRSRRAAAEPDATPSERIATIRESAESRARIDGFSVQAEELTRRLAAILDNKAARIEALIEDAERAAERLERAKAGSPPPPDSNATTPPAWSSEIETEEERINALAAEGKTPVDIARATGLSVGRVELVLALTRGS